jgi:hypothetical protein
MASIAQAGEQPLHRHLEKVFRWDTKAIVAGVLLGVVMVLIQQLTERLDTVLTGGIWFPFAGGTHSLVLVISCIFYRLPAGWITGEMNALFAFLFQNTPVAPAFAINNFIYPIIAVLISKYLSMRRWWHYVGLIVPSVLIGYSPMVPISMAVFNIPLSAALFGQALTDLAAIVIASILAKPIADAIARSGLAD